jgi:hypothetical protein
MSPSLLTRGVGETLTQKGGGCLGPPEGAGIIIGIPVTGSNPETSIISAASRTTSPPNCLASAAVRVPPVVPPSGPELSLHAAPSTTTIRAAPDMKVLRNMRHFLV